MLNNARNSSDNKDPVPVIKLFMTNTYCTWLITELDPTNPDIAFGLCDLGMGFPEVGYVSISELEEAEAPFRYLERAIDFKGTHPLSIYAKAAYESCCITTNEETLERFVPPTQTLALFKALCNCRACFL